MVRFQFQCRRDSTNHTVTICISNNAPVLWGGVEFQTNGTGILFDNLGKNSTTALTWAGLDDKLGRVAQT